MAKRKAVKKSSKFRTETKKDEKFFARLKIVPLKGTFMLTSIFGFIISAYWVFPQSYNYGFTFMFIFALMFIASIISMTKAPIIE